MAKYTSRYPELGFYVHNEFRQFYYGRYETDDAGVMAALDTLSDAVRVDVDEVRPEEDVKAPAKRKAPPIK